MYNFLRRKSPDRNEACSNFDQALLIYCILGFLPIHHAEVIFLMNRMTHIHLSRGLNMEPNNNRQIDGNVWVTLASTHTMH